MKVMDPLSFYLCMSIHLIGLPSIRARQNLLLKIEHYIFILFYYFVIIISCTLKMFDIVKFFEDN